MYNEEYLQELQNHRYFIDSHTDSLSHFLGCGNVILRKRYLLLTGNHQCAALLLDVLQSHVCWNMQEWMTCTLQELREELLGLYTIADICQALRLLIEGAYIYHAPEPRVHLDYNEYERNPSLHIVVVNGSHLYAYKEPAINENHGGPFTFLVDRVRIRKLSEGYEAFFYPGLLDMVKKEVQRRYKTENARVEHQCLLAREQDLLATLTLAQWVSALDYFNWHCAYCGGAYQVLEHFVPLVHGGGTEWSNCVPACRKCNSQKGTRHPALIHTMPLLQRVRNYLANIRLIEAMLDHQAAVRAMREEQGIDMREQADPVSRYLSHPFGRRRWYASLIMRDMRKYGVPSSILFLLLLATSWVWLPQATLSHEWPFAVAGVCVLLACLLWLFQVCATFVYRKDQGTTESLGGFPDDHESAAPRGTAETRDEARPLL